MTGLKDMEKLSMKDLIPKLRIFLKNLNDLHIYLPPVSSMYQLFSLDFSPPTSPFYFNLNVDILIKFKP